MFWNLGLFTEYAAGGGEIRVRLGFIVTSEVLMLDRDFHPLHPLVLPTLLSASPGYSPPGRTPLRHFVLRNLRKTVQMLFCWSGANSIWNAFLVYHTVTDYYLQRCKTRQPRIFCLTMSSTEEICMVWFLQNFTVCNINCFDFRLITKSWTTNMAKWSSWPSV